MKKLKKCPFCGVDCLYETFEVNDIGTTIPVMFCNSCKIVFKVENDSPYLNDDKTYEYLKEKTSNAWNTRKPLERVIERLETESDFFGGEPMGTLQKSFYCKGVEKAIEIIKQEMM